MSERTVELPGCGELDPTRRPEVGRRTLYRAISGDVYEAVVERIDGHLVDINVVVPGTEQTVRLSRVPYRGT